MTITDTIAELTDLEASRIRKEEFMHPHTYGGQAYLLAKEKVLYHLEIAFTVNPQAAEVINQTLIDNYLPGFEVNEDG